MQHVKATCIDQKMDEETFTSETWQRVYQYLEQFDRRVKKIKVKPEKEFGSMEHCLRVLLR